MGVNFGWQFTDFQKLTARYDLGYDWYGRDETTAEAFVTPTSTFTNGFTLGYELRRHGYSYHRPRARPLFDPRYVFEWQRA